MKDHFTNLIKEPTKENYFKSWLFVTKNPQYAPYSDELNEIEALLEKKEFKKVVEYASITTLLSPRVHFMKAFASKQLGDEIGEEMEGLFGVRIMDGVLSTGDGTIEQPYFVTQVADERDVLSYIGEKFVKQQLIRENNKVYDLIKTESGKEIYFDISVVLRSLNSDTSSL